MTEYRCIKSFRTQSFDVEIGEEFGIFDDSAGIITLINIDNDKFFYVNENQLEEYFEEVEG